MGKSSILKSFRERYTAYQGFACFLIALLSAVSFNHFVLGRRDPNKCYALMNEGTWYHSDTWLAPGCVTPNYGINSMHECMKGRTIVLAGDESMQSVFWELQKKLDSKAAISPGQNDTHFSDDDVKLEFIWDPYLNRSELDTYAEAFRRDDKVRPTLLVVGATRHHAELGNDMIFDEKVSYVVDRSTPEGHQNQVDLRQFSTEEGTGDLLLFAPVQEPYTDPATPLGNENPHRRMNSYLDERANKGDLLLLSSFNRMTAGRADKYDGARVNAHSSVMKQRAETLISLRCNYKFASTHSYPNVRTCCGSWRSPNWQQTGFLAIGLIILPLVVLLDYMRSILRAEHRTTIQALSLFTATISLLYVTDRTHVFEKVERLSTVQKNLYNMIAASLIFGVITIRRCGSNKKLAPGAKQPDQPFLARDQTDELKGWMQLGIIIYHYNEAFHEDWFWFIIRTCVAAYLFLTGFGHTLYFIRKGDYSAKRFVAVMVRTNLLPSTLAYVMRTTWLKSYYMPLSTFWFAVVYATLAIGSKYNKYRTFVIGKMAVSAFLVNAFISTRDLPETVVHMFDIIFRMEFHADSFFHYRLEIDKYIVYIGMLTALFYIWAQEKLSTDSSLSGFAKFFRSHFQSLKTFTVVASGLAFAYFWYWVHMYLHDQHKWTALQPYLTCVPIISYLVLRNANAPLRNYYSFAFAWLGKYSGEMYVIQNHIWLAGDQNAILRTGFFHGNETVVWDRWRDLVIITPLYLIACCFIGDSTATITTWFTKEANPKDVKLLPSVPVSEVEMGLLDGSREDAEEKELPELPQQRRTKAARLLRLLSKLRHACWPSKTRDRALVLLAWMWFLNLTYR